MLKTLCCRAVGIWAVLAAGSLQGAALKHDFVAIDEGLVNLLRVDENNPAKNWIAPVGRPMPRDLQLIGGGRILRSQ